MGNRKICCYHDEGKMTGESQIKRLNNEKLIKDSAKRFHYQTNTIGEFSFKANYATIDRAFLFDN